MIYINALMVVVALVLLRRDIMIFKRVTVHAIFLSLLGVANAICVIINI